MNVALFALLTFGSFALWFFISRLSDSEEPKTYTDGEFDIESVRVVSVERSDDGETCIGFTKNPEQPSSAIGHQPAVGEILEWYLPVSPEKHQELVARFRKKMGLTYTPKEQI